MSLGVLCFLLLLGPSPAVAAPPVTGGSDDGIWYLLSISATGSGSGVVYVNGLEASLPYAEMFLDGSQITLEADADGNSQFGGWSGVAAAPTIVHRDHAYRHVPDGEFHRPLHPDADQRRQWQRAGTREQLAGVAALLQPIPCRCASDAAGQPG